MNQYTPETRQKVESDIDAELATLSHDRKLLLRRIYESMHLADYSDTGRIQETIARFAALLCSLSIQADKVQRWIVILTVTITAMTLVLLVLTFVMTYKMFSP